MPKPISVAAIVYGPMMIGALIALIAIAITGEPAGRPQCSADARHPAIGALPDQVLAPCKQQDRS